MSIDTKDEAEQATKIAAEIAHKVLDYLNSDDDDEEDRDDWCAIRDIAKAAILGNKASG